MLRDFVDTEVSPTEETAQAYIKCRNEYNLRNKAKKHKPQSKLTVTITLTDEDGSSISTSTEDAYFDKEDNGKVIELLTKAFQDMPKF